MTLSYQVILFNITVLPHCLNKRKDDVEDGGECEGSTPVKFSIKLMVISVSNIVVVERSYKAGTSYRIKNVKTVVLDPENFNSRVEQCSS